MASACGLLTVMYFIVMICAMPNPAKEFKNGPEMPDEEEPIATAEIVGVPLPTYRT
jgi:hypothetical protein